MLNAGKRWARRGLPFVVSGVALAVVLGSIDTSKLLDALSWRVLWVMAPALLAYGAATLTLETASLRRLVGTGLDGWTAARIKCASYLLGIVHYALGAAALSVLLRRRAGTTLAEAASVVLLISFTDLVLVLGLAALASTAVETGAAVSTGALALGSVAVLGALLLVRAPTRLGPLERIRSLGVFDALRRLPLSRLAELLALRTLFAGCYVGICSSAFLAFGVMPPPALLVAGILVVTLVAALPIAVAGLGTSQIAVVAIFRGQAEPEVLVAISLALSGGLVSLRAAMGFLFAREFAREALAETQRA